MYMYMNLHEVIHSQSSAYLPGGDGVVVVSYVGFHKWLKSNLQEKQKINDKY